jgi:hypothetical protein
MKKIWTIAALFAAVFAFAGDEQLIGDKIESGGFGGPMWKATGLNGKTAFLIGGRGGWIVNHAFIIGGGGYNTMADVKTGLLSPGGKPLYLGMHYGGLEFEFVRHSEKLVHWTVQSLFGAGHIRLIERDSNRNTATDRFGVADIMVNAELNVSRWMRVNAGAGYRLVFGIESDGLGNDDIGGPGFQVTFKFGTF